MRIKAGLGNQMFQYALVYTIAKKRNFRIYLDLSYYGKHVVGHSYFQLQQVTSNYKIKISYRIWFMGYFYKFVLPRLSFLKLVLKKFLYVLKYIEEPKSFCYNKELFNIKANSVIEGYFQSPKYFEKYKKDIIQMYKKFSLLGKPAQNFLKEINNISMNTAIHFRDYTYSEGAAQTGRMDFEYYQQAIRIILEKEPNSAFYVFSDNMESCKKIFNRFTNVDINYAEYKRIYNWEDLFLISKFKNNIIGNSSYSWWAAYLNEHSEKIVIAPKSWGNLLKGRKEDNDLFPEDWVTI